MLLEQYGFSPALLPQDAQGLPARITAAHRDRFALVSEEGEGFGRLKTKEYYTAGELFPERTFSKRGVSAASSKEKPSFV